MHRNEKRVAALESNQRGGRLVVIRLLGGLADPPPHATAGDLEWTPIQGESGEAFSRRAMAEADVAGAKFLIFGGLRHEIQKN